MDGFWPSEALRQQAGSIGPAILELIDSETRWVHRRTERIELLDTTQMLRTVAADVTVPLGLQTNLALYAFEDERGKLPATEFVLPLGLIRKGPVQDIAISPPQAQRLTSEETAVLMAAAVAPYARATADPLETLRAAYEVIAAEESSETLLGRFEALLDGAEPSDALARLRSLVETLNDSYVLLVAVGAQLGVPLRLSFAQRQVLKVVLGKVSEPPLVFSKPLELASVPGPPLRVEVAAPDGLEIQAASIVGLKDGDDATPKALDTSNTRPGGGGFVQLRAPDGRRRTTGAQLQVIFGWPGGSIHQLSAIAALTSTAALAAATLLSFVLNTTGLGSAAGTILAAPGLVTGLALGFAPTRLTSRAANRLRLYSFGIAVVGVAGALVFAVLAGDAARVCWLRGLLIACTVLAFVGTTFPLRAALRARSELPEPEAEPKPQPELGPEAAAKAEHDASRRRRDALNEALTGRRRRPVGPAQLPAQSVLATTAIEPTSALAAPTDDQHARHFPFTDEDRVLLDAVLTPRPDQPPAAGAG